MSALADASAEAQRVAADAAARAGVRVADLDDVAELERACELFDLVWGAGTPGAPSILPTNLARALSHSGNFLAAAYSGADMVGAAFGFLATAGPGLHLHSHLLAVDPQVRTTGIGVALKQHQRSWALARGLEIVRWTYDPLVARNGFINLCKLGTKVVGFHSNFYGAMRDGINEGDESDRLVVEWDLVNPRTIEMPEDAVQDLRARGLAILEEDEQGLPIMRDSAGQVVLCKVPRDIVELRRANADGAASWRQAARQTLGVAISDGYSVTGLSRSGWYRLER